MWNLGEPEPLSETFVKPGSLGLEPLCETFLEPETYGVWNLYNVEPSET